MQGIRAYGVFIHITAGMLSLGLCAKDMTVQRRAVETTLVSAPQCQDLGDLYWEIGDAQGVLASGQVGRAITAERVISIASASKWVFGAYVAEKTAGKLTPVQIAALHMRSGYDQMHPLGCAGAASIDACLNRGRNGAYNAAHAGLFSYNGGHDQKLAHDLGIGAMSTSELTRDLQQTLGVDIAYAGPQPAGGMAASPAAYGAFLRKILKGELQMSHLLGSHAVCTLPAACAQAVESPAPYAWHYSLNHWVEDGPQDDEAFSSAGLFGFYPWIAADRSSYGTLARMSLNRRAGMLSADCGAVVRRAWVKAGG